MQRTATLLGAAVTLTLASVFAFAQPAADAGAPAPTASAAVASASAASSAAAAVPPTSSVAPSTSAPAPPAPAPTASAPAVDGPTYAVRLRDLESRVDELKEQIRRSHTRLAILSDTIMSGGVAGSRSEIQLVNEMSGAFRLIKALFIVDGAVQYNTGDESGAMADKKEIAIFNGAINPGDHTISVVLNFQGHGFGLFTYLRGYKFEVKSSHSFTALEGKNVLITAVAHEKGGVTTPLEQRPSIEWREKVSALTPAQVGKGTTPPQLGAQK